MILWHVAVSGGTVTAVAWLAASSFYAVTYSTGITVKVKVHPRTRALVVAVMRLFQALRCVATHGFHIQKALNDIAAPGSSGIHLRSFAAYVDKLV